ncbi:MAG: drug/metabolite exporter YedA [Gemmatimonadota bacterium]
MTNTGGHPAANSIAERHIASTTPETPPARWRLLAAFAAVYLIWGSTYLAIRIAIETLPPFLMAAVRFACAGLILYAWARLRGAPRPTPAAWRATGIIGGLLLLGGNGSVVWAEQTVPSGIAALMVAGVPLWMVLFDWLAPGGTRPAARTMVGLLLGLAGLAILVGPSALRGVGPVNPVGAAVLMIGSVSWAAGSIYARHARLPDRPLLTTGMQMLVGALLLAVASVLLGEPANVAWGSISPRSALALLYLVVFGAIVAYSAYVWLLRNATAARVSTYAFVNPLVAVLLGWGFANEPLTPQTLAAAAVIVAGVALITLPVRGSRIRPGH